MVHFSDLGTSSFLTFGAMFEGFREAIEMIGIFVVVGTILVCSIWSSSRIVLKEIFPVREFLGRFVRSSKSVDLRLDYLALVGVVGGVFSMVQAKILAGIGSRVARLRGALPARG